MSTPIKPTITIIGAGLAGCFLAILFSKRGYSVEIYERSTRDEVIGNASKRSFNLTFYGYAIQAFKDADLWTSIEPILLQLKESVTQVGNNSQAIHSSFDPNEMPYYTVSRSVLLETLINEAEKAKGITFHFNTSLHSVNRYEKTILIENGETGKVTKVATDVIFGADGVNSVVRGFIQQGQRSNHLQEYASWTYKQIVLDKKLSETLNLQSDAAYAWTRKNAVMLSFPNTDGSVAALLVLPNDPKKGFAMLNSDSTVKTFITENFADLLPAVDIIAKAILENPEGHFSMIHTEPWFYKGFMTILGDAAHGFFPFFGQGTSAAFGDALKIVELVDTYGTDWEKIFSRYQEVRKHHMDILGELSKEGFDRYRRYKKADYSVIYDKLESVLHTIMPNVFLPSLFELIAVDPDRTAEYFMKHKKQRRFLKYIGIPLLVSAVTAGVAVVEKKK